MRSPLIARAVTPSRSLSPRKPASGWNGLLNFAVDDGRGAKAAAAAHRLEPVAQIAALELVEETVHEDRARGPKGMADRDRPAVDVGLGQIGAGLRVPRVDHRGSVL